MTTNQVHPAAIRSKLYIVESLLELMANENFKDITVKQITANAQLTRRTFYSHFKTKEEVINYKIANLNNSLIELIKNHNNKDHREIAILYFRFWMDHANLLILFKECDLLPLLFDNFAKNIQDIRSLFGCKFPNNNQLYADYSSALFTGILSIVLNQWIHQGAKETAEELVDLLELILRKFATSF